MRRLLRQRDIEVRPINQNAFSRMRKGAEKLTPTETDMDLRSRVVQSEHRISEIAGRLLAVETWRSTKEVADARNDERMTALAADVKGIKSGISRLFWIVVGAIVVIVVTFALSGGFVRAQEAASALLESPRAILPAARPLACPMEKPVLVQAYCRALPRYRSVAPVVPVPRAPLSSEALLQ